MVPAQGLQLLPAGAWSPPPGPEGGPLRLRPRGGWSWQGPGPSGRCGVALGVGRQARRLPPEPPHPPHVCTCTFIHHWGPSGAGRPPIPLWAEGSPSLSPPSKVGTGPPDPRAEAETGRGASGPAASRQRPDRRSG